MLTLNCCGIVSKEVKHATSTKGLAYCKFQVEIPQGAGKWPKRVGVTVFGTRAQELSASNLNVGALVALSGDPQARGYQNNQGKILGVLEMIAYSVTVLPQSMAHSPVFQSSAPAVESKFTDDDIPF
jgi:hypothetical protein